MVARCGFIVAVSFVTAVLAGCGSQQATPLSIAKTEAAFSAAGIPLQADQADAFFVPKGITPTQIARLPRALTWGEAESLVLVYPTTADAVQAFRRRQPGPTAHVARAHNVLVVSYNAPLGQRVLAAVRRLRSSS